MNSEQPNSADFFVVEPSPEKRLCLVGVTGSGKSTLGNVLLGFDPESGGGCGPSTTNTTITTTNNNNDGEVFEAAMKSSSFATGSDAESVTRSVQTIRGLWRGSCSARPIKVIDTPGHGDTQGQDEVLRRQFVEGMASEREIDAFVWVKNAQQPRYDALHQEFFALFVEMFGAAFYRNLVVVFTHWGFGEKDERKRRGKTLDQTKDQLWTSICEGHGSHSSLVSLASYPIPMVAVDALHDPNDPAEAAAFEAQLEELWTVVNRFSRLPVMDVRMVRDRRAELMAQLDAMERAHEEERARMDRERRELAAERDAAVTEARAAEEAAEQLGRLRQMEEERRRLAEKIKYLEQASSPPWWLQLLVKIGELMAKLGVTHLADSKYIQKLKASKDMQSHLTVVASLTSAMARQLLAKYVDGRSEEESLDAAYAFFGLPRGASEDEVDLKYKLLEAQFEDFGGDGGAGRNNNCDPTDARNLEELRFAHARIKAHLHQDAPGSKNAFSGVKIPAGWR